MISVRGVTEDRAIRSGTHCCGRGVRDDVGDSHHEPDELRRARCAVNASPWKASRGRPNSRNLRSRSPRPQCRRKSVARLVRNRRVTATGNTKVAAPTFRSPPHDPVQRFCAALAPPAALRQIMRRSARPALRRKRARRPARPALLRASQRTDCRGPPR